jgi:lariat debranching enzyme
MVKVAVVGCGHGELDNIYKGIQHIETTQQVKIDLLLVSGIYLTIHHERIRSVNVGDFQSVRNEADLACMRYNYLLFCPTIAKAFLFLAALRSTAP